MILPAVIAEELEISYGSQVALTTSSFTIPREQIVAVIGPNGSGKSTLLNAIAGLVSPSSGSIVFPGRRPRISYVLQSTKVNESLPITVREVVAMGRFAGAGATRPLSAADREAVAKAMERTAIETIGSRHLHELSGGQRQRVFVAQGLAQDHDILLLDEPLTGIDLTTARAIDDLIHDEQDRGRTVVLTTHDLTEAQVADYVLLLSGRVVASGSPADVLTTDHLVDAYGPSLLHVGEEGRIFLDDPAHTAVPGRHVHRERTIHTEGAPEGLHGLD